MSIPKHFQNNTEYFKETVLFLKKYQWLYRTRNTHILVENIFDRIQPDWLPILHNLTCYELNNIPSGYVQENWPKSLQEFICKIQSLKPDVPNIYPKLETDLPQQFFKGLSQKKIHEILILAPFIHENCVKYKTNIIIDIGSGLGYLPELLNKIYGYKILAIEANSKYVETALKRQKEMYSSSLDHIKYIHHFVDSNSAVFLQQTIDKHFKNNCNVCLIGLHACADLSVTFLKLFAELSYVNQAVLMPCCYHRLKLTEIDFEGNSYERFVNFPVSNNLREIYENEEAYRFLSGAFLRLACQNSAASWERMTSEDHERHSIGAMRRNILQYVAEKENYHLRRLKRKTHISENLDFSSYLDGLKQSHSLTNACGEEDLISSKQFREQMTEAWKNYNKDCQLMEAYTSLQTSLQSICENIVLLDRVEMMKELGFFCSARKVTDDSVSPRCYAIVARKQE